MAQQQLPTSGSDVRAEVFGANRGVIVSTLIFSFVLNVLALTGSIFMLQVYDRVIPSGSVPTLVALSGIVAVLYIFYGVLDGLRSRIFVRMGRRLEEALRNRSFDAMSYAALKSPGAIGNQPVQDVGTLRQFVSGQGPQAWFDMPYVPLYLGVIFLLHWSLGLIATAAAAIIFILALLTERAQRRPAAAALQATLRAQIMTEETRKNAEAMHALGMKSALRARWAAKQGEALDFQTKANDAGAFYTGVSRVFRLMVQSGMLGAGAYLAVKHEISAGSIIASSIIMGRALAPIEMAVAGWPQFLNARKAYERLWRIFAQVPKEQPQTSLPPPVGELLAENVVIVPQGADKPILQGVSFKVAPGRGLGIIGPTGAGKSSLARALVGITPLAQGAVRLDGATPDQRDSDDYGRVIGYLPQDVQIFDGTVAENISRFAAGAPAEKIVEAARQANIHDFILRLPKGYDTPLGDSGARLSAGQRQRLALARALYGDPVLIVMDEPNSNLDAEGEQALDSAIRAALKRQAAVVVVAHRPSALTAMHDILILANGKAAAFGPTQAILAKLGLRGPNAPGAAPQKRPDMSLSLSQKITQPGTNTRN